MLVCRNWLRLEDYIKEKESTSEDECCRPQCRGTGSFW